MFNFNAEERIEEVIKGIQTWFGANGPTAKAVIGISGGKDSTVTAALLARALGKDRVIGVMMPNGEQEDIEDSIEACKAIGIKTVTINIQLPFKTMLREYTEENEATASVDAEVNLQPRLRMAALYMVAQSLPEGGRVINTCNRSEDFVGWATKFGDCAGDLSVIGNLTVTEIVAIGRKLEEVPRRLVEKAPADGLCGQTDDDKFGFHYADIDNYILLGTSGSEDIDKKIEKMYNESRHKYRPMPMCTIPLTLGK